MNSNLTKSTAFGVIWTGVSQVLSQGFQFIVIIILARLLYPQDFGVVGMASIFTGFISRFNELGLSAAIIQRKKINDSHLSTSFWTSLATGIILCFLTILVSPYVADYFQEPLVQPILTVSSFNFIIGAFTVIPRTLFTKSLDFKKLAIVEICATIISGIISILLALNNFGAWSLVFGVLSLNLISVLLFWRINTWRPSIEFSFQHFKELFGFGSRVMGSGILNYIDSNVDYLVVGKFIGASALGYYTLAYNLITFPLYKISTIITRVTFPAFSRIQDDNHTLRTGYLKVVRYISVVTFPMLAGMFVIAPEFILVVYGSKWVPMILTLQILCLAGALKSVGTTVGTILLSKGRADIQFKWNILTVIVLTIAVLFGVRYGIEGVAAMVTISALMLFFIIQGITNKLIYLGMYDYFKAIFPAITGSISLIIAVSIYKKIMIVYGLSNSEMLISSIILGIMVYVMFMWIFFKNLITEIKSIIYEIKG